MAREVRLCFLKTAESELKKQKNKEKCVRTALSVSRDTVTKEKTENRKQRSPVQLCSLFMSHS